MKLAAVDTALQPHQQRVVDRIQRQPGLVVAHGVGTGKTLASLAAAESLGGTAQVVAPAALQQNYKKEIAKHVSKPSAEYKVRSLQGLTRSHAETPGKLLVVDEAHRLRDPGSKARGVVTRSTAEKRLLLTGSPLYNRPHDLAGLVNLAAGENALPADRAAFDAKYVGEKVTKPGILQRLRGVKPGSTAVLKDPEGLSAAMKKWVDYHENSNITDFPTRNDTTVEVPFGKKQRQVYDSVIGEAPAWVRAKVRSGLPPSKQESKQLNAFLNAARQVSVSPGSFIADNTPERSAEQSPKIQQAFARLQDAIKKNPEHRAVVYSNYLDSGVTPYESLLKKNNIPYGKFTGDMNPSQRAQMVQDYNSGKLRALLVSSAGGEGLDLKRTRQIQVLEPHWNKEKVEQVVARGIRYQSHSDLPEDQRRVDVEHYVSTLPEPGRLKKLFGGKRPGAVDEYLRQLSSDKDLLNQQVRDALRRGQETYDMEKGAEKKKSNPGKALAPAAAIASGFAAAPLQQAAFNFSGLRDLASATSDEDRKLYADLVKQRNTPRGSRAQVLGTNRRYSFKHNPVYADGLSTKILGKAGVIPKHGLVGKSTVLGARHPITLAHELGHHAIGRSIIGKLVQNPVTTSAGRAAALGGVVSGIRKGRASDNASDAITSSTVVPAAMAAPMLAYEGVASVHGYNRMRQLGASPAQLARARQALTGAFGTYAAHGLRAVGTGALVGGLAYATKKKGKKAPDTTKSAAVPHPVFEGFAKSLAKEKKRDLGELDLDLDLQLRDSLEVGSADPTTTSAPRAGSREKTALIERLIRLGATDVGKTPRLFMKQRGPEELAALQHGVTRAFRKYEAPMERRLHKATAEMGSKPKKALRTAGKYLIRNPHTALTAPIPVPGLDLAVTGAKRGLEHAIDRFAPIS